MAKINEKKSNRRLAFRVYEQVNLFYQKIGPSEQNEPNTGNDAINHFDFPWDAHEVTAVSSLPHSQSQENATLNVNISSSGIAFSSLEELAAGDILLLRILFLSSMTAVTTCCKVVYCKPSNPYESNRYPHTIGAQFLNIRAEDREILNSHVSKRKHKQLAGNIAIVAFILAFLAAPGEAFGLFVELIHHFFEVVLHVLHLAFEFLEMTLDHYIEHHFHTDTHETQVIVFYTIVIIGMLPMYFFLRMVISALVGLKQRLLLYITRKKSSFLYAWGLQTQLGKIKIIGIGATAIAGYIFFGI
jgi:hypothetical protein